MHGIIVTVLYQGVSPVMCSRGGCGFQCVGGSQKNFALLRDLSTLLLIFLETPLHGVVGWGCFFTAVVSRVGLFLCSSSGGGAVLQWFQRWNSNNFVSSHSPVMPILYAAYTDV